MMKRCTECGGRFDRPGLFHCESKRHPAPTIAQRIVLTIEHDLRDRRGMGWDSIDDETQDQIRDEWVKLIEKVIRT